MGDSFDKLFDDKLTRQNVYIHIEASSHGIQNKELTND